MSKANEEGLNVSTSNIDGKFAVKVNKDNIDNFTKDSENNEALETSSTGIANNEDENIDNTNQELRNCSLPHGTEDGSMSPKMSPETDEGHDSEFSSGSEDEMCDGNSDPVTENECAEDEMAELLMSRIKSRTEVSELPHTVTKLESSQGCIVYLVGTAHFSTESHEDVAKTIQAVKPDIIVLELCKSRLSILQLDEQTVLEESKNLNLAKMRATIKQSGFVQGIMYIMLLSISANVTKSLGMAPGGEFRRAVLESRSIPGCLIHLGDRPIQVTMQRALSSLTWYQSFHLMWQLLFNQDKVTVEDVERCKQRDLLEEMLIEMTGDYPALSRVFVHERDIYLTHSLQLAASPVAYPGSNQVHIPTVVVGVVGIGHVPGIINHWNKVSQDDIAPLMMIPKKSRIGRVIKTGVKLSFYGLVFWGIYKVVPASVKSCISSYASAIPSFFL